MALYDIPKTSITRAKSKFDNGEPFVIKNKLHYEEIEGDVVITIDAIAQSIKEQKSKPRYILVNDYSDIAAIDTKTHETLNIPIEELPANADFFLAWNGIEKLITKLKILQTVKRLNALQNCTMLWPRIIQTPTNMHLTCS